MRVYPRRFSGYVIEIRNCSPTVYIAGMRLPRDISIDNFVHPLDVAGVEVYKSAIEVPGMFAGLNDRCGAIIVWTH
ncbi:MAG: hypothetical protein JSW46_10210 [Gemmatimonadota bacterium]|nr:MAG: hypothetical protein JSW46_10210 [Gemmatimonadota bacterium]